MCGQGTETTKNTQTFANANVQSADTHARARTHTTQAHTPRAHADVNHNGFLNCNCTLLCGHAHTHAHTRACLRLLAFQNLEECDQPLTHKKEKKLHDELILSGGSVRQMSRHLCTPLMGSCKLTPYHRWKIVSHRG